MYDQADCKGPNGVRLNSSTFYLFAQRVAWGEAKQEEVDFMGRLFDLVERRGEWDVGTNDYMG